MLYKIHITEFGVFQFVTNSECEIRHVLKENVTGNLVPGYDDDFEAENDWAAIAYCFELACRGFAKSVR